MNVMHLTSSRFFGGPERQMLGLAKAMRPEVETVFVSFSEDGLNQSFLEQVSPAGFTGVGLRHDTPRLLAARREIVQLIKENSIRVLLCHGYKAGIVGWFAARKARIPAISVSRGWTRETWKVAVYEHLDRMILKRMQRIVCVSNAQASKVQLLGIKSDRIAVIHNSICLERFRVVEPIFRQRLLQFFPVADRRGVNSIIGAAGRLSPEKGFDVLIEAAKRVVSQHNDVGFVLFGDGKLADDLRRQIQSCGLEKRFILAGFTDRLDRFMPHLDLFVQSSRTEGLPNVLLESLAAGVPVVATDVGGTSEALNQGLCGELTPPANPELLADAICQLLAQPDRMSDLSVSGKVWVESEFSFDKQVRDYQSLFQQLIGIQA